MFEEAAPWPKWLHDQVWSPSGSRVHCLPPADNSHNLSTFIRKVFAKCWECWWYTSLITDGIDRMEKRKLMEAIELMDVINGYVEANEVKRLSNFGGSSQFLCPLCLSLFLCKGPSDLLSIPNDICYVKLQYDSALCSYTLWTNTPMLGSTGIKKCTIWWVALWSFRRPGNFRDFSNGSETVNFPGLFWWPKFAKRKLQTIALSKERGQNQADVVIVAHNSRHCRYKWHHCRGCDNTESGGNDDCAALPEYMLSQKNRSWNNSLSYNWFMSLVFIHTECGDCR